MKDAGHDVEYSKTGKDGLSKVSAKRPDIIIIDLQLPDMSGHEILKRLRRDVDFNNIPVIVITSQNELGDKLKAFELGADDYLTKPFQPEELVARMRILARRGRALQIVSEMEKGSEELTTMVAVHSLRGGIGTTSLAVNLGLAFNELWNKSTVIMDTVMSAGQVAMMLDSKPRFTWEDMTSVPIENMDQDFFKDVTNKHDSGISFVAAPRTPIAMDTFSDEFWRLVLENMSKQFEFVVIDTGHDFSDITIQMLNASTTLVLMVSPEMSGLRSAMSALEIYDRLGFPPEKIKVVLNQNLPVVGIRQPQIEKVLERKVDFILPYDPDAVIRAVNFGEPFLMRDHNLSISKSIEDMAYTLSDDIHKNLPPAAPTDTWKRVTNRLGEEK